MNNMPKRVKEFELALMNNMPKRVKEFELEGDYEGWKFTAITSFPTKVLNYIQTGNMALIESALSQILLSWNFVDYDGNPLPPPGEKYAALDAAGVEAKTLPDVVDGKTVDGTGGKSIMTSAISELPPELLNNILVKITDSLGNLDTP